MIVAHRFPLHSALFIPRRRVFVLRALSLSFVVFNSFVTPIGQDSLCECVAFWYWFLVLFDVRYRSLVGVHVTYT